MGGVRPRSVPWWGVRYGGSGTVHDCPYGKEQAEMIWMLALQNGVKSPALVQSSDRGVTWH
jgi:hypothetical protein